MAERHKWADVIIAWANGETIQFKNATVGRFLDYDDRAGCVPCFNDPETEWRIKPRTIKIGDMEVPEPLRVVPENGDAVFIAVPTVEELYVELIWKNVSEHGWNVLRRGVAHLTKEAAIAHAKALILVSGGRVE